MIDPRSNHRLPSNWASSDETAKAPWTTIANTGVLDLGMPGWDASAFHALMFDDGECLLDDVEVYGGSSSNNLVPNGDFEAGTNGWVFEGNHETSYLETNGGYSSPNCLHICAHGAGDSNGNRVYAALTSTIAEGATATLRARVRWLRGDPEVLLRLRGSWLEADGLLTLPAQPRHARRTQQHGRGQRRPRHLQRHAPARLARCQPTRGGHGLRPGPGRHRFGGLALPH